MISNYTAPPIANKNTKGMQSGDGTASGAGGSFSLNCGRTIEGWTNTNSVNTEHHPAPRDIGFTEKETIEMVVGSNFPSQLSDCIGVPDDVMYKAFAAAEAVEKTGTRPVPAASSSDDIAQCQTTAKSVQVVIKNPAVTLTKRGFCG
jgi:hypothetical protein